MAQDVRRGRPVDKRLSRGPGRPPGGGFCLIAGNVSVMFSLPCAEVGGGIDGEVCGSEVFRFRDPRAGGPEA
jgi:hypothetical protein